MIGSDRPLFRSAATTKGIKLHASLYKRDWFLKLDILALTSLFSMAFLSMPCVPANNFRASCVVVAW